MAPRAVPRPPRAVRKRNVSDNPVAGSVDAGHASFKSVVHRTVAAQPFQILHRFATYAPTQAHSHVWFRIDK